MLIFLNVKFGLYGILFIRSTVVHTLCVSLAGTTVGERGEYAVVEVFKIMGIKMNTNGRRNHKIIG